VRWTGDVFGVYPLYDVYEFAQPGFEPTGAKLLLSLAHGCSGSAVSLMPRIRVGAQGNGGAGRDRTDDLKLAKLPLSQLSYSPSDSPHRQMPGADIKGGGPGKI
jgi:hypothetical protein